MHSMSKFYFNIFICVVLYCIGEGSVWLPDTQKMKILASRKYWLPDTQNMKILAST